MSVRSNRCQSHYFSTTPRIYTAEEIYIYTSVYISAVLGKVLRDVLYFEMSPRETKRCAAGNVLFDSYGPRSIGSAVESGAWETEGSTVTDLVIVEGKFLRNNYHNECSMLPISLLSEHYLLQVTFMTFDTSV